jgi:transcription antitermination factor NusG
LIRVGDCPCRIPDYEIEALEARADDDGIIHLPPPPPIHKYSKGDRVKIIAGQFAHFDAIHTGMSNKARERVLISILGARREITVASHLVAPQ